jgi:hypothetical protein
VSRTTLLDGRKKCGEGVCLNVRIYLIGQGIMRVETSALTNVHSRSFILRPDVQYHAVEYVYRINYVSIVIQNTQTNILLAILFTLSSQKIEFGERRPLDL